MSVTDQEKAAKARDAALQGALTQIESEVEREGTRGNRLAAHLSALVAHPHDRALAELTLDLRERTLKCGVARLGGLLLVGHGHGVAPPVRDGSCNLEPPSDGTFVRIGPACARLVEWQRPSRAPGTQPLALHIRAFRPETPRTLAGTAGPHDETASIPPPTPALRFAPTAATLFRSWQDPAGARYEPLASIAL